MVTKLFYDALAEQFNQLNAIINTIPHPMALISKEYQYLAINNIYVELFDASLDYILGHSVAEFCGQSVFETEIRPRLDRCLSGETVQHEVRMHLPGKGMRWMSMEYFPYREKSSRQITGVISHGLDITERKQHEQILAACLRLSEGAASCSLKDLLQTFLDQAEMLTGSKAGFFHFLEPDQATLSLQVWSTNTLAHMCETEGKGLHSPVNKAGVWVDCIRQRRAVIHNDYRNLPHRKGLPEGHGPMIRELVAPIIRQNKIAAVVGLGNKETDYTANDIDILSELTEVAWDIVLRKQAEDELSRSEARLKKAQRLAHIGSWELDLLKNRLLWSEEVYRIFETLPENYIPSYDSFLNDVHPEDRQMVHEIFQSALNNKTPYAVDHRILLKDGRIKFVHEQCEIYYDPQTTPVRCIGTIQDITARKQTEAALETTRKEFITVLDGIDSTIYVADLDTHKILFMNRYMKKLFGGDFTGELCWTVLGEKTRPCSFCNKKKLLDPNGKPTGVRVWEGTHPVTSRRNIYHDRAVKWVDGRMALLQIATDVTQLREMEARQIQYERRLQYANKMEAIGTLAGGIAHDFNNILFPLIGYAEMLKQDIAPGGPSHEYIDEIMRAAHRSRDLVQQILTFSRRTDRQMKPIRLQEILAEAIKLLRASIPSTIAIQPQIDEQCELVLADPTQIHQIVVNLATNAYHAMASSGGRLKLTLKQIRLEPDLYDFTDLAPGDYALINVSDTGSGIAGEIIDKVFDPYFTTKGKGEGTGLGLSIVRGIVGNCSGDVRIYSEPGKGTEVHVYLPVITSKEEIAEAAPPQPVTGGSERILLVDDEPAIVNMEEKMLERLGYHVTKYTASLKASEAFKADPQGFDLVMTDMTMPQMTGIQLAKEVKTIRPDIPVIICTGFSEELSDERYKIHNIQGVVNKPVLGRDMAEAIRKALDEIKAGRKPKTSRKKAPAYEKSA